MSISNPNLYGPEAALAGDSKMKRKAAFASLAVAITLIGAKFAAFLATNSVSILSSLMDSAFDFLASLVALISITQAASPADHDHRFGHGKIESLGALTQALFIAGSGVFLFVESMRRFVSPLKIDNPSMGLGVMVLSIVLTLALVAYQKRVISKTGSVAIAADSLHYQGDLWMNLSVLVALLLGYFTKWPYFDPLFALCISFRLLYGTWEISRGSFDILLDKELPDADRARIIEIVKSHPAVYGVHDLRSRHTGERMIISFHVEMDAKMTIKSVHNAMDEIEEKIFQAFPKAEVFIHPEPAGLDDHRLDHHIENQST